MFSQTLFFNPRRALASLWGYTRHLSSPGSEEEEEEKGKLDVNLDNKMAEILKIDFFLEHVAIFRIPRNKHATTFIYI